MAGVDNSTETELTELKANYGPSCRIINDCGDYKHMVTVTPHVLGDISIKFQITESYPDEVPQAIVISGCHDDNLQREVTQFLAGTMDGLESRTILSEVLGLLEDWLATTYGTSEENEKSDVKRKQKKSKKSNEKDVKRGEDEGTTSKLSSMKTAIDVISRIQWDGDLSQECFSIGYLDRFTGIIEKGFEAFSWEDIASVDYETLAIPKHRIQYFKYKNEIVWDKTKRLDNVFGSTGSGLTIVEVIERYEREADGNDSPDTDIDEEEDGVVVRISAQGKGRHVRITPKKTECGDVKSSDKVESCNDDNHWSNRSRPNYFIAIRVSDPEILSAAGSVQEAIVQLEPQLKDCVIQQGSLHVTLCTLRLDTTEQIADAARCLNNIRDELKQILDENSKVDIRELDNFHNRVLHAKVFHDASFVRFVDCIKTYLQQYGFQLKDVYAFRPHMTLVKLSRSKSKLLGPNAIDPSLYQGLENIQFGQQSIDAIHLCSMLEEHQDDGFYHCVTSVEF